MEAGHPQLGLGVLGGLPPHGEELLVGRGEGRLDRGDLTEPALVLGLLEPVDEVGVDFLQARYLGWVNPE